MSKHVISLNDRTDLSVNTVLLNGTQALVRLMLMQSARDKADGLNTGGYVTGYRGSPLGAVDFQMQRAKRALDEANVTFQEGLNEDLAATALWGTQQAELRGEGKFDGVFGLWYGKGPGVDRSGDVFRHANFAGTSPNGGVLAALGDDHTGESSTSLHQSEFTMLDSYIPVLSPAGVQEILDLGLTGYALSRFAGVWTGLKCLKDTVEATSVVNGDPFRMSFKTPDFAMPPGGLNIRLMDTPQDQEARMIDYKRRAVEAFAYENKLDRRMMGRAGAKIGFVAAGKNWLDLTHAMSLLGIDDTRAELLGVSTYKVAMTWPLETKGFLEWADGLDLIVVVEEKRKLIEAQIKDVLFNDRGHVRVIGGRGLDGQVLFPDAYALEPVGIAQKLGQVLEAEGRGSEQLSAALAALGTSLSNDPTPDLAKRIPYFCSGCPHNSSTKVPDGSRAYAGIGCHYMVQWMDRETIGFTHMGGEGANWIGEAPFSHTGHVFQNLGDGTYNHSGVQAIRAALLSDTTITYKILFNDAVAMTGGQRNDGGLTAEKICAEVKALGVQNIALVHDEKEAPNRKALPAGVNVHPRADLDAVQTKMAGTTGVSVIVYAQTCAAEKRRRRKRDAFPDPKKRVFINPDICEGCGDCGVQSNCVSILPLDTPLGRKRQIDQSSCNKDFSCVKGFCPSFVTVEGGGLKQKSGVDIDIPELPGPDVKPIDGTHNVVITGVGGTGVVTIGAVLAMAAHLDGKGAGMMEMAGLAQKGGAVHIHCRLAESPSDISAIRVAIGECDALIGGDLVVSGQRDTTALLSTNRSRAVVNRFEMITGDFARDREFRIPGQDLEAALRGVIGDQVSFLDATQLAEKALGDSVYANMILFGAGFQAGLLPISEESILRAIALNGAKIAENQQAFRLGRYFQASPEGAQRLLTPPTPLHANSASTAQRDLLAAYGSKRPKIFAKAMAGLEEHPLADVMAASLTKLLTYKDEYEVARLLRKTRAQAAEVFDGDYKLKYHLAPPLLSRKGPDGRPQKRTFGSAFLAFTPVLARLRFLRGTPFDIFGYTKERKYERNLIKQYQRDMKLIAQEYDPSRHDEWAAFAALPDRIRGFGPVKMAAMKRTEIERMDMLAQLAEPAKKTLVQAG